MATKKAEPQKKETVPARQGVGVLEQMPEYLKSKMSGDRGNENVDMTDLVIPRLEVMQALSPGLDKSRAEYIKGAEGGDLYNNVTREIYEQPVLFVPVAFKKDFILWKQRKHGGGFNGAFPTMAEAQAALEQLEHEEQYEILDTPQQFGLIIKTDGGMDQIVVSMPRTKAKVSRRFNSLIRNHGGDRWSRAYKFGTTKEKNSKGEFFNFTVTDAGFVSEKVYNAAEALYEDIMKGRVKASTAGLGEDEEEATEY